MKLGTVIRHLEQWAPPAYQESYDNSRLLTGNPEMEITGILVSLDATENIIEEALAKRCNVVVCHHPVIFGGLKSLTGKNYVERTVIRAVKNDVAIYAIHTNLDNVAAGVNKKIADLVGLTDTRILSPVTGKLMQLEIVVPHENAEAVRRAAFDAGAGSLGAYREGWFGSEGVSGFTPEAGSRPVHGEAGRAERLSQTKLEFTFPSYRQTAVWAAVKSVHPYREPDHRFTALANADQNVGAGMIGRLPTPEPTEDFLKRIKQVFGCGTVKYTAPVGDTVSTVALCGGAGFFLLPQAVSQGADVYLTSDVKYHEFFDADGRIVLADIGHYESEQFTRDLIAGKLAAGFPELAVAVCDTVTNPVHYL